MADKALERLLALEEEALSEAAQLKGPLGDARKSLEDAAKQGDALSKEFDDAKGEGEELADDIKKRLDEEHREDIDQRVQEINSAIEALRGMPTLPAWEAPPAPEPAPAPLPKDVNGLKAKLPVATLESQRAEASSKARKEAFDMTVADLKQLPADLTAVKDRIAKAKKAMRDAYDKDDLSKAYLHLVELGYGLTRAGYFVPKLLDPASAEETRAEKLAKEFVDRWKEYSNAAKNATDKAARLALVTGRLATARADLQKAEANREADLQKVLDEL